MRSEKVVVRSLSVSECSVLCVQQPLKNKVVPLSAAWCFRAESLSGAGNLLPASNGRQKKGMMGEKCHNDDVCC